MTLTNEPTPPRQEYTSYSEVRENLSEVFDAAQAGYLVNMRRGRSRKYQGEGSVSVVKSSSLGAILFMFQGSKILVESVTIKGPFSARIVGIPGLSAEGETLDGAVSGLIFKIRRYCSRWSVNRTLSGHGANEPMVMMFQCLTDDELANLIKNRWGE